MVIVLERYGLTVWGKYEDIEIARTGTWGQIISAFGATIAFIIALTNLIFQRTQYLAGESRREQEEETSIYIWITVIEEKNEKGDHIGWQYDLTIQNSTKFPIVKWVVNFLNREDHFCSFQKKPLLPGENTFNLKFLDDVEPSKLPETELIFESKTTKIWKRKSTGVLETQKIVNLKCNHN